MKGPSNRDLVLVGGSLALLVGACHPGSADSSSTVGPSRLATANSTNRGITQAKCPRPTDEYGPLYYEMTGMFQGISVDPGGGKFVVLKRSAAAVDDYLRATDELIDKLGVVRTGTVVTLVSYRVSSRAGAHTPFSCFELA